jgi:hypothetical protein
MFWSATVPFEKVFETERRETREGRRLLRGAGLIATVAVFNGSSVFRQEAGVDARAAEDSRRRVRAPADWRRDYFFSSLPTPLQTNWLV